MAAEVVGGWLPELSPAFSARAAESEGQEVDAEHERQAVEEQVRHRARRHLKQRRLVVDYYRIGRTVAYPLPLRNLVIPEIHVPSLAVYPWATWLLWTLEERVGSLGWAAEWFGNEDVRRVATADLAGVASWSTYQQYSQPDLCSAHAGRILWTAATRWQWLSHDLRRDIREACIRHAKAVLPASDQIYASVSTKEDVLKKETPHSLLHNIPLIGTIGAALTATAAGHSATARLNARVEALFGAVLDLRSKGHTEGVGYDGYVLDFVADWLSTLPESERSAILDHPNLDHYLDESYMLGAPGAVEQVAELSDVEPLEMPFHLSAQAKLLKLKWHPTRSWLIASCPVEVVPCSGLAALRDAAGVPPGSAPPAGALDAHYAAVLRGGWGRDDLAVAVSCSRSPMSHIQRDSGTLVLGTRGKWLVTDPGYQQYVKGEEREFTIGATAHNTPVIDNLVPNQKRARRKTLQGVTPSLHRAVIDLTDCYPTAAHVKKLVRHVWLSENNLVVVADEIEAAKSSEVTYHWHGHPDVAWWFEEGWALMTLDDAQVWLTCSRAQLTGPNLQRLAGSRGQLSLISKVEVAPVIWWAFVLAPERPVMQEYGEGEQIRLLGQSFNL